MAIYSISCGRLAWLVAFFAISVAFDGRGSAVATQVSKLHQKDHRMVPYITTDGSVIHVQDALNIKLYVGKDSYIKKRFRFQLVNAETLAPVRAVELVLAEKNSVVEWDITCFTLKDIFSARNVSNPRGLLLPPGKFFLVGYLITDFKSDPIATSGILTIATDLANLSP